MVSVHRYQPQLHRASIDLFLEREFGSAVTFDSLSANCQFDLTGSSDAAFTLPHPLLFPHSSVDAHSTLPVCLIVTTTASCNDFALSAPAKQPTHSVKSSDRAEGKIVTVGILVIDTCNSKVLDDNFNVDYHTTTTNTSQPTLLRHLILRPHHHHRIRWILEESFRLLNTTKLFATIPHTIQSETHNLSHPPTSDSTLSLICSHFVPVEARRQVVYPNNLKDGSEVPRGCDFSLKIMCLNRVNEPRLTVNARIVVVGASDTGMAFVNRMLNSTHLHFCNLTVVTETTSTPTLATTSASMPFLCDQLPLKYLHAFVGAREGLVTAINRASKEIEVRQGDEIFATKFFIFSPLTAAPATTI